MIFSSQVDKGTCKLAYMRAALSALASVHGTTLSWMKSLGGREALLSQYGTIKEHVLPRNKVVRTLVEETMFPFLMYMTRVQPDIAQQLMVKFIEICADIQHFECSGSSKVSSVFVPRVQRITEEGIPV